MGVGTLPVAIFVFVGSLLISRVVGQTSTPQTPARDSLRAKASSVRAHRAFPARPSAGSKRSTDIPPHPIPVRKVVIEVGTPPVPGAADLRPAMSRAEIILKCGNPDVLAAWTEAGWLYEKLTYFDGQKYTELLFRNGILVSSHTENDER
jgi:hypothetical protein